MQTRGNLTSQNFGEIIKKIRTRLGFNLTSFSEAIQVEVFMLQMIERGQAIPTQAELQRIFQAIDQKLLAQGEDVNLVKFTLLKAIDEYKKLQETLDFIKDQLKNEQERVDFYQANLTHKDQQITELSKKMAAPKTSTRVISLKMVAGLAASFLILGYIFLYQSYTNNIHKPYEPMAWQDQMITAKLPKKATPQKAQIVPPSQPIQKPIPIDGFEDFVVMRNGFIEVDNNQKLNAENAHLTWKLLQPLPDSDGKLELMKSLYDEPILTKDFDATQTRLPLGKLTPGTYYYKLIFNSLTVGGRFVVE